MRDLINDLYEIYGLEFEYDEYCGNDCGVEPPAMVYECPNCKEYEPRFTKRYPVFKCTLDDLLKMFKKYELRITVLADKYSVCVYEDDFWEYDCEDSTLERCLLRLVCQMTCHFNKEDIKNLFN